jgi:hypothetical protein
MVLLRIKTRNMQLPAVREKGRSGVTQCPATPLRKVHYERERSGGRKTTKKERK